MAMIWGERERRAGDDAWVSGLNNWGIGGSINGDGDMRMAGGERCGGWSGGTEGWGPCSLKGQPLLGRNEGSGFSEVRNPHFCLKALDFYMSAINSNLKCHIRANPMQVKSSPSVVSGPQVTSRTLCSFSLVKAH